MKRLVIQCPDSNLATITTVMLGGVRERQGLSMSFACPCGNTHEIGVDYARDILRSHRSPSPAAQRGIEN